MNRLTFGLALAGTLVIGAVACGGGSDGESSQSTAQASTETARVAAAAPDLGRVVALGEEFLLADVLALGVKPVASTATVVDAGFQGLDQFDTEGIEPLSATEPNLERLAGLRPDTILAPDWVIDAVGRDKLEAIATVIDVPTGTGAAELTALGAALGRPDEADALVEELAAAEAAAVAAAPADCEVSVATIYGGPTPAAWVAEPSNVAVALLDVGCVLAPSADDVSADGAGRVYLSLEQLGQLSAPKLILLQSDDVEGERASLDEIEAEPLWQQLPAVQAGEVTELDRLGYPGVAGLIRLYAELATVVG